MLSDVIKELWNGKIEEQIRNTNFLRSSSGFMTGLLKNIVQYMGTFKYL